MQTNKNSIIISHTFYPVEGGIQTYLLKVAENWPSKIKVFCNEEKNVNSYLNEPVPIQRFKIGEFSYFKSIIEMSKILFFGSFSTILLRWYLLFLLIISRSVITNIAGFTKKILNDIKTNLVRYESVQCSVPISSGVIGLIIQIMFNIKLVIYIHGSELLIYNKRWNYRLLIKLLFRNTTVIISNSNYTKEIATKIGVNSQKVKVINLGADVKNFYPLKTKDEIYTKYNIPKNHKLLYTISHLIPRKGNDMIIKAMPKILKENPDVTYLIGGKGEYKTKLEGLIKKNHLETNVKFTGFIEENDLNKIMNACDIFVMPNRQEGDDIEGYGIVFMEANACKKPVIVGRSGGAVDAVIDGVTGLLVNPLSSKDIANKILYLLKEEKICDKMGLSGFNLVKNERNWDKVTQKVIDLITN